MSTISRKVTRIEEWLAEDTRRDMHVESYSLKGETVYHVSLTSRNLRHEAYGHGEWPTLLAAQDQAIDNWIENNEAADLDMEKI